MTDNSLLANHLAAYLTGTSEGERANLQEGIKRIIDDCELRSIEMITRANVEGWLAKRRGSISVKFKDWMALSTFADWLVDTGRLKSHDLNSIFGPGLRRTILPVHSLMSESELDSLAEVVAARDYDFADTRAKDRRGRFIEPSRHPQACQDRAMMLKTCLLGGLRPDELTDLTVGQLNVWEGDDILLLGSGTDISKIERVVPLSERLASDLRDWQNQQVVFYQWSKPDFCPLFAVRPDFLKNLERDLKNAQIDKRAIEVAPWLFESEAPR